MAKRGIETKFVEFCIGVGMNMFMPIYFRYYYVEQEYQGHKPFVMIERNFKKAHSFKDKKKINKRRQK